MEYLLLKHHVAGIKNKYGISRRILQRTRAKLSRLGLIEHVSYLNNRYGGEYGWKFSTRFENALKQLADKSMAFRDKKTSSKEKDLMLVDFADTKRVASRSSEESMEVKIYEGDES